LKLLFIENQPLQSFYKFWKFLPTAYKKGFIFSLLFRYFNICSSYQIFHAELEKFKKLLLQNGYTKFFIDRCVKTFLDKMISLPLKVQTPTVSKLLIPIVLPYTGNHAIQIRQNYTNCFPRLFLKYNYVWFLNQYAVCLIFSISKTVFLLIWNLMSCINLSVNAVKHCIWAKHADIYTHESPSIAEFRLWLAILFRVFLNLVFRIILEKPVIQLNQVILKLLLQLILTIIFLKFAVLV
jgi:hypothetical protein